MGSGSSTAAMREEAIEIATPHVLPLYYIKDARLTADDALRLKRSWAHITMDTAPNYLKQHGDPLFSHKSCAAWFYSAFYSRLFDVHPSSRPLFQNNMVVQGRALAHMIGATLGLLDNKSSFVASFEKLAVGHSKKGVMSFQYGIAGEVLFWTFEVVLGPEAYDADTKLSWILIYSIMLRYLVPAALREESKLRDCSADSAGTSL